MKNKKGFTLIEMLVVVLIIGILAGIALPQYQNAVIKAQFAEAYVKLKAAAQIEEMCRLQNGLEYCGMSDYAVRSQVNEEINQCQLSENGWCPNVDWDNNKFYFQAGNTGDSPNTLTSAIYSKDKGVCICITKDYKFVLTLNDCADAKREDYPKILGIPDVTGDEEQGCYCC